MANFVLSKATGLVAHYTSLDVCCEHILPTAKLRFSPLQNTNDPYEFKKRLSHYYLVNDTSTPVGSDQISFDTVNERYLEIVQNHVKVLCVTGALQSKQMPKLRCYMRPRMWAQYGDNHLGAALLFDRTKLEASLNDSLPNAIFKDVNYVPKFEMNDSYKVRLTPSADISESIYNHLETYIDQIFATKNVDWESEDERRSILINRKTPGFEFVEYGDSLVAIVMGINADSVKYLPLIRGCDPELPIYQCGWATRGEIFTYRHHPESFGGLEVENFDDGHNSEELVLWSWPADDR